MDMIDYIDGRLAVARDEYDKLVRAKSALTEPDPQPGQVVFTSGASGVLSLNSGQVVLRGGGPASKKRTPEQRARMGAAQRARFARAREVREQARRNVRASAARMAPFGVGPA